MKIALGDRCPEVHDTCWIAPNATVIGDARLGKRVSIWYNAVVRADMASITIGDETNVQDGCALHVDPGYALTVGRRVSVGHNAVLHGCTIGDDVLIGMGATVLNGAKIGSGTLIAANTVILGDTTIGPGSLVAGVPGKVRRALTDEERNGIKDNAAMYLHARDLHSTGRRI
ncbi:gamma carbonic anhydrase family protein (plasmid) [Mycobacterium dioxanotrophicus]|uniref:Gamma carbonic anhydrase family protein n=1 Tax=Mycobacterium dioxanotrophicus TaxID=482462 RepID=A0A1Y0CGH4_9MYCO|nr:gamma carbonic anhydrase family protein [Mycobacterium dioxanotrophicus]ART74164.1 gamma carbonic anhydrase family protein [Mycobacterium dioxanotrophicus]